MKNNTMNSLSKTALTAALLLELTTAAQAATINVDNNLCTLADAITSANTDTATASCTPGNGEDVIELPANSSITLTDALPEIVNDVTINANDSTINRDANAGYFTILTVNTLATLTLNNATISGGSEPNNYGAGISVFDAELILNDSTITNNTGGGIVIVRGNNSMLNNVNVINNISADTGNYYGSGVSVSAGNITIQNSTISGNTATSGAGGGGIYVGNYAGYLNLSIANTTISNNVSNTDGGGINHYTNNLSDLVVNISNSTIINNSSPGNGGGIANDAATSISISQSIISGNTATGAGNEISSSGGTLTLSDYNIIGLNDDDGTSGITVAGTNIVPSENNLSDIIDPVLADNGGSTFTHNLVADSPAVDAIMPANCPSSTDQIGQVRGNDGNGDAVDGCDIGSIEFQPKNIDLIFKNSFEPTMN